MLLCVCATMWFRSATAWGSEDRAIAQAILQKWVVGVVVSTRVRIQSLAIDKILLGSISQTCLIFWIQNPRHCIPQSSAEGAYLLNLNQTESRRKQTVQIRTTNGLRVSMCSITYAVSRFERVIHCPKVVRISDIKRIRSNDRTMVALRLQSTHLLII